MISGRSSNACFSSQNKRCLSEFKSHCKQEKSFQMNNYTNNNNFVGECDDEWVLRKNQGSYFLRIGEFMRKTRWPSEIFLDSKLFIVGNAKFKLRFFPNINSGQGVKLESSVGGNRSHGSSRQDGFVGVYVFNESSFDVLADLTIKLGSKAMTLQKQFVRGKECIGKS